MTLNTVLNPPHPRNPLRDPFSARTLQITAMSTADTLCYYLLTMPRRDTRG